MWIYYLDFQKAFDSVPHHRLMVKLRNYGITDKTLDVISDFLSGRSFTVKVGDSFSAFHEMTSGIPQGSVLGPLLFLLYINDLPEGLANYVSLFADDVKMIARSSTPDLNQLDLNKLCDWQNLWLLRFNMTDDKCKVMHIGKENPLNVYHMEGYLLPPVNHEKDLGVVVSSDLKWDTHIDACIKKAIACSAWVTRTIISREKHVMLNLYKTLIRPHLEYCVQLWTPVPQYGTWGTILAIEHVQRRFTRLIDGVGLMPYRERLDKLGITTLLERRARGDLIETFKIVSGIADYGKGFFKLSHNRNNLVIPVNINTPNKYNFISRRVVKFWNKLHVSVKISKTVESFKTNLE